MARERRKLAAIMAADVVGYAQLMGRDEAGTLLRLKKWRGDCLEPSVARNGGRIVKLTGDGVLTEFGSAVDALRAAVEFQQAVAELNADQPDPQRMVFRVGIHLGDLIVEGSDLYGDGVNVAARLEPEAPPGGIVISRAVRDAVAGKLKTTLRDLGELSLKNIEQPIQAFQVDWDAVDSHPRDGSSGQASGPFRHCRTSLRSPSSLSTTCRVMQLRNISRTVSPRTLSRACRKTGGCSSSLATRALPIRVSRPT